MRVYQLAKDLGIEPEVIMAILEERGESAKSVSSVSKASEAFIREQMTATADSEEHEAEADPDGAERVALPAEADGTWTELTSDDEDAPEVLLQEVTGDLEPVTTEPEVMAADDRFELVSDNGAFRETLCLDPHAAALLRKALKGRQVVDACLYPDRQELHATTWPDYQKVIVRPYD